MKGEELGNEGHDLVGVVEPWGVTPVDDAELTVRQRAGHILQATQHDDDEFGAAWRDRMQFRQHVFAEMIRTIADNDELDDDWTIDEATAALYAIAQLGTWRELTQHLGWSDDRDFDRMAAMIRRSLLRPTSC